MYPLALKMPTPFNHQWSSDGQSVSIYHDLTAKVINLKLSKLKDLIGKSIDYFEECLLKMIPKNFDWKTEVSFDNIFDNCSISSSVFEQEPFQTHLRQIQKRFLDSLKDSLQTNSSWNKEKIKLFFKQDQSTLDALALTIVWTCGYPPRGFQLTQLKFRESKDNIRNLFIMFNGLVVLGFPKQKGARNSVQASLWALPKQLLKPVLFYLGVIRRVAINILEEINISFQGVQSYIFVKLTPKHYASRKWNGSDFNQAIKNAVNTMGFEKEYALTDKQMRQLIESIISKHLPTLSQRKASGEHNISTGHTTSTGSIHYGRDAAYSNNQLALSQDMIQQCLATSQVLQWFWGIGPLYNNWNDIFIKESEHIQMQNQNIALSQARYYVMLNYHLKASKPELAKLSVEKLLTNQPYLGDKVNLF